MISMHDLMVPMKTNHYPTWFSADIQQRKIDISNLNLNVIWSWVYCVAYLCSVWPVYDLKCLYSWGWEWVRKGGPLSQAFQYLFLLIWRPCELLTSKCQHFKLGGLQFHFIKWLKKGHSNLKVLAFWSQWRYYDQIQNHKVFIS